MTGAFKNEDKSRVSDFRGMISDYDFEVTPISWDIAEEAARKSITGPSGPVIQNKNFSR